MKSFETIHPNHKMAFVDGAATAAVIAGFVVLVCKIRFEDKIRDQIEADYVRDTKHFWDDGMAYTYRKLSPFVDKERYEKVHYAPYPE